MDPLACWSRKGLSLVLITVKISQLIECSRKKCPVITPPAWETQQLVGSCSQLRKCFLVTVNCFYNIKMYDDDAARKNPQCRNKAMNKQWDKTRWFCLSLCCKKWWVTIQYTFKILQKDISEWKRFYFFSNASANCFLLKCKDESECSTSSLLSLNGQYKWRNSVWCSKSLWGCCKSPGSSVFVFLFPCSDEISSQILP